MIASVGTCVVCGRFGGYARLCRDCTPTDLPCRRGECAPEPGRSCCMLEALYERAPADLAPEADHA